MPRLDAKHPTTVGIHRRDAAVRSVILRRRRLRIDPTGEQPVGGAPGIIGDSEEVR